MPALPSQDPSSPGAVAGASFPVARKGFDPTAVRDFLRQVSQELGRVQHERDRLSRELDEARESMRRVAPEDLDEATVAAKLGEEAARVLSTAHEASAQIRARAEETMSRLLRDAELDAARQRGDAEVEAARRRQEAEDLAEAEVEAAKVEGREMVAEARDVRERIFADLTRRRDLARQQIEALHAGRQRMMEAMRGARRELDGILAGLEAHAPDEADEELPPLDLHRTGPTPVVEPAAVLVLGEMDVPAAIVERHIGVAPADEPEPEDDDGADPSEAATDSDADLVALTVVTAEVEVFDYEDDEDVEDDDDEDDDDAAVGASITAEVPAVDADDVEAVGEGEAVTGESSPDVDDGDGAPGPSGDTDLSGSADDPSGEVDSADAGGAHHPASAQPDVPDRAVDDLFARLRASSAQTVAREVLEEESPADDAGPADPVSPPATLRVTPPTTEPSAAGADAIARRQVALKPVRIALARQLKRVLADEQNEVLDRLRQRHASLAVEDVLGPASAHPGTYREAAEDQLWAAATAGADALSDLEGEALHAALEARSVLDRCLDTLESELVVPLRARLTENLEASGDATEAAGLLRATYREWKGRIDELGEDLVRTAYGRASYAVLAPGSPVCWVFDPSGPDCPDAEDNVLAGAVPAGEPFPTGHRYAPAYRGCRCLLVPDPG